MAKVEVSEGFVEDMTQVYMDSKREEMWYAVSLLEFAPEMGSRILPIQSSDASATRFAKSL